MLKIREAAKEDLEQLLELYTQLNDNVMPEFDGRLEDIWNRILADRDHHILVGLIGGRVISSCVVVIVPNLTRGQRPYALIENVVTDKAHRNKGYATQLLDCAKQIAVKEGCYKIALMTGSKEESTLNFYRKAGYNSDDKTAFIQWL